MNRPLDRKTDREIVYLTEDEVSFTDSIAVGRQIVTHYWTVIDHMELIGDQLKLLSTPCLIDDLCHVIV